MLFASLCLNNVKGDDGVMYNVGYLASPEALLLADTEFFMLWIKLSLVVCSSSTGMRK